VLGYLDWALTQELQPSEVTQCWLRKDLIFIIKILITLHEIVQESKLEMSRAKLQQKFENWTNFQQPNEALGLSTYTTGAPKNSLKIREAWLLKLEIDSSYPPLARLSLWCIDVAACALSFLKENSK